MWQYLSPPTPNELYHYGIKGMKWGVRRFQNKDGSLTKLGRDRYNTDVEKAKTGVSKAKATYKKALTDYYKKTKGGLVYDSKASDKLIKAAKDLQYAKDDLSDAKVKVKMSRQAKKSDRQIKFEQKYKEQGMNQEEAELAAYKRVRTEKIIAVTAGMTITAAAAYVAYKHYDNNVDKIIKSGKTLQNISTNSNKGVSDAFYASMNKIDNAKYRGIYGQQLKNWSINAPVYETKIGVDSGLKIASKKSATQALSELVKSDKTYSEKLKTHLNNLYGSMATPKQNEVIKRGLKSLNSGKVDSHVYEALNLGLVDHSPTGQTISKGFYDLLKSKGYDGIKDINDSKYSGYKSVNPLLIFNGASKTSVKSIREVGEREVKKNLMLGYADIVGKEIVKTGAAYTAGVLGLQTASKTIKSKSDEEIVKKYRKEHPESTLSYKEIVRMHERQDK